MQSRLLDMVPVQNNYSSANITSDASSQLEKGHNVLEAIPLVTDGLDGGWFGKIGTSAILVFGTFGNLMTIIILHRLHTGWSAMNVYLTALAMSDTAMLYSGALPIWTWKVMHFDLNAIHVVVCKGMVWVMHSSAVMSAWFLVALTAQRAASVVWPHRVNIVCTRRKSILISIMIMVIIFLLYSHTVYGYEVVDFENGTSTRCTFGFENYQQFWVDVWVRADIFIFALLPCCFLIVSNAVLGWKLAVSVKEANQAISSAKEEQRSNRKKRVSSITVTIISVSTTFVLINLPLMTYNTVFYGYLSGDDESTQFHYFLYDFFVVIALSNFAVNFYLYCLTGTKLRREFMRIMFGCCGRRRLMTGPSQASEGTQVSGMGTAHKRKTYDKETNDDF